MGFDDVVRLARRNRNNRPCAVVGVDVAGGEEWFVKPAPKAQAESAVEGGEGTGPAGDGNDGSGDGSGGDGGVGLGGGGDGGHDG